ncbi:PAS domain-containing sensor histidine kinase [Spirosoma flavum]|uniref:histidine kinase n=1 Tax=Spirosoma flavum TaxID=2048557 RepID=A0ABW6AGP1_9BACT
MPANSTSQMPADLPTQLSLAQLFDSLPDNVLWMRAVRDPKNLSDESANNVEELTQNQIVDFVVDYVNPKARQTVAGGCQVTTGKSVRYGNSPNSALTEQRFQQLCDVVESGRSKEFEYFDTTLGQWLWVTRSKAGDGVLSISRSVASPKELVLENERQRTLLDRVLNSAFNTVFVYEAIRGHDNQIQDFSIRLVNERGRADVLARLRIDVEGKTLLTINPDSRQSGQFNLFCQVIESGHPIQTEQFYPVAQAWYNTSITKLNDGVVVIGSDITEQKQSALETERQRTLLNGILNASQDAVVVLETIREESGEITDFRFTHTNSMATQLLGHSVDGLFQSTFKTLYPGPLDASLFNHCKTVTQTGESYKGELLYEANGLDCWYGISAVKLGDGVVLTFTDTSAAKRAAMTIEQSADELRTVIDSAQVAIFLINPVYNEVGRIVDFRFRTANQLTARYVNQDPDALTGELVSRWFPDYLTNGLFRRYVAIFETGRTQHFNFHFEAKTIDSWENYTVLKVGNDVLVTFTDYTELKKLQQRLEASATELQTVVDTCQTGIFLFSPVRNQTGTVIDFRFRMANQHLASYVGQKADALVGALGSKWFPDYKTNGLFDAYYKTYSTGESYRFDFHYDGSGIDVWLDIKTTKSGDDVLVTFGDYTPLKQLQQQLENSVIELQRSNKNLEQFAYVASHDLQEPLRKIQAFGDIIQSQFAPVIGEGGADLIARMQSAAARMQVLIKDVLAYSRIATKRETVAPVDLNQLVVDVLSDIETAITDKQAVINVELLPTVRGDAAQLRQLFQNLVSNALKFTKTNKTTEIPTICISTSLVHGRDRTEVSLPSTDADRLFHLIEIADNGIGFDPRHAERIFQVFQRLHGRSEYQGTGIGLAIVQKVVDNHQGHILAEGRPGQGATFRILLPV